MNNADGSPINVIGKINEIIRIDNETIQAEIIVLEKLSNELLIGLDILDTLKSSREATNSLRKTFDPNGQNTMINNIDIIKKSLEQYIEETKQMIKDITADSLRDITTTSEIEHEIILTDNKPFNLKPRQVPYSKKEEFKKMIDDMLVAGLIVPSKSPYASPVRIVRKSDGSMRITIDYRKLNSITVKDNYPLPRIDDMLAKLKKAKIFSKIDFASGYFQVKMATGSRAFTAFICEYGVFEFTVMPMGMKNSGATFQRLMNKLFENHIGLFCIIYIDDTLVFSESVENHAKHLKIIFDVIRRVT